jgi:uncharacterized protein YacL
MITLNTVAELTNFLNNNDMPSLVGEVVFSGDLLDHVRSLSNAISIDEEIGFCDDGGEIVIDDNGNVVSDMYLP